jgi:hypothetical protein
MVEFPERRSRIEHLPGSVSSQRVATLLSVGLLDNDCGCAHWTLRHCDSEGIRSVTIKNLEVNK